MASYTTLVDVDADTASKLAQYVSTLIGGTEGTDFNAACKKLIEDSKTEDLVAKFLGQKKAIFAIENDGDVLGFFEALVSVTFTLREDIDATPVIKQILKTLSEDTTNKPKLRLKAMVSLFNLASGKSKYDIIIEIFRYALATNQSSDVSRFHERVDEWVSSWNCSVLEKRALYQMVSEVLGKDGKGTDSLALGFLIKYLGTYGSEAFPPDVQALVTTALVSAVKSPVSSFEDRNALLESFTKHKQQATGALGQLLELLKIICTGSLDDFRKFEGANKALFSTHAIVSTEVEHSIRLLTLCSLGSRQGTVSYDAIVSSLKIPEDEVEMWVVDAISVGLLDATMDQFSRTVTITRHAHRSFGMDQWKDLQQRLAGLRATVAGVIESSKKYNA